MIRKTVLLLLVFTGIIPFACCPENPSGPYKLKLYQVTPLKSVYMHKRAQATPAYLLPNETYTGDTLLLELTFLHLQAQQQSSFAFHTSALALSCDDYPNYTHLKDKVAAVEVYSNKPFNNIAAGEPLTEKVLVYHYSNNQNQVTTLSQAIININSLNYYDVLMGLGTLIFPEKPDNPDERTFTMRVRYESGLEESLATYPIRW